MLDALKASLSLLSGVSVEAVFDYLRKINEGAVHGTWVYIEGIGWIYIPD